MATIPEILAIAVEHHQAGRLQAAERLYRQILAAEPHQADAMNLLGVVAYQVGRHDAAVEHIARAIELRGTEAVFHFNLGCALRAQGKLDEGIASYRRALALNPDLAEVHNNLGIALGDQGKPDDAVASFRRALALKPDFSEAFNNLGIALRAQGKFGEAADSFRRALKLKPDDAEVHSNLGAMLKEQGKLDEAVACHRRALELRPDDAEGHSNLLCTIQGRFGVTLSELDLAHREYDRRHAEPLRAAWRPHENLRDPNRVIRLGFVSPDLARHPVGYFLVRVLENLDRGQCEAICYSDRLIEDDMTTRLRAAAGGWQNVVGLSHQQLAEQIRADRIDVLFDLAGHTAGNRLLTFARKPAPIQVTWAGYVGTTGLEAMNYILADRYEIPPQSETYYRERVLRMPDGYICYDPPDYAPPVSPLPAIANGHVTFAAFHNAAKITREVVEAWTQILQRLPGSRLVLRYQGMDDPAVSGRIACLFAGRGIDPARLEFLGFSLHRQLLAEYQRVDLALDTFPYNGGLTTCEALWMGVPVVTCPGETFAGRHSLSHLSNVGLTETIARDLDEYVELAVAIAGDLPRLAALRSRLRERMAASPLCDGKRFAGNLMRILRDVWREWCEGKGGRMRDEG